MFFLRGASSLNVIALVASLSQQAFAWPNPPFSTSDRMIYDECGNEVLFAGINWPGAAETMLPEGLQYSSIENIVSSIKSLGLNVIRLTYAIEMIDDHLDDSPNSSLNGTLWNALGSNGEIVLGEILSNNPQFTANTTRLEVFDAVAEECARQELWVHLDNHQSRAYWCCPQWDGNAWFNDTYFSVFNWTRGLGFMADRAQNWEALVSMSLRNELRPPSNALPAFPYNWEVWLENMVPAATGIHGNNSLPLIFFSGIDWDYNANFLVTGYDNATGAVFNPSDYTYEDKMVFEIHNYDNNSPCESITNALYTGAYGAYNTSDPEYPVRKPIVLSEFGFDITDGSDEGVYAQCIKDFILAQPNGPGSWMQWVLAGSYYIRIGAQDSDETWGLFNHNWTAWRNQTVIDEYVIPFIEATIG